MPTTSAKPPSMADRHKITGLDYDDDHVMSASTLRFAIGDRSTRGDPEDARRLIAAIHTTLARRADGPDVEALDICFVYASCLGHYIVTFKSACYGLRHEHAADVTSAHVAEWLRFAERRVTGSFTLAVPPLPSPSKSSLSPRGTTKLDVQLPATARAQTISLSLAHARLTVPAARAFHALTDLLVSQAKIDPSGADGHNLGRMLSSSCCPRLRRLRLEHIEGLAALHIVAASTLEDLRLVNIEDLSSLELDAPDLRTLHITGSPWMSSDDAAAKITAPRLEVLVCPDMCDALKFTGAGSVRRLEKLHLWSHYTRDECPNSGIVGLLTRCTSADSVDLTIMPPGYEWMGEDEMMSLVPRLPNIIDLTIDMSLSMDAFTFHAHRIGGSIARFVSRCSSLQRLDITITNQSEACSDPSCFCRREEEEPINMSLEHLREAKITGFRPADDQISLLRMLIAGAPGLETMTVQFGCGKGTRDLVSHREDADEELVPCDRGHWSRNLVSDREHSCWRVMDGPCEYLVYTWTSVKQGDEEGEGSILSKL